jgi:hypothetical protein
LYAGTRARVEARATLVQAEELRRIVEKLGERLGDKGKRKAGILRGPGPVSS